MIRNYKYRIYPTAAQSSKLNWTLEQCRCLWNVALEQRKTLWSSRKQGVSAYDQYNQLSELKAEFVEFKDVYSQVLQNVLERLDLAYKSFFRRIKRREKAGHPRFRSKGRYDSFCYPQSGFKIKGNHIYLSKIGHVPIVLHRETAGKIKRCTVQRTPTGKWFVVLTCEEDARVEGLIPRKVIGIDVGIKHFATMSDGSTIENPRFFKGDANALAKAQRRHQKAKTQKSRKVIARIHERIRNRRENFAHQLSRKLVDEYDCICVEDLNINKMKEGSYRNLNREISDVSWRSFIDKLSYKAEWAGKRVVKVNPAYTSQDCSACGYRVHKRLQDRVHNCPNCGLVIDRDLNAALNILTLGTQSLASNA